LDPALRYRVNDLDVLFGGDELMYAGCPQPLMLGDYQSGQLYLRAVEDDEM
jgi:hypothetical protein